MAGSGALPGAGAGQGAGRRCSSWHRQSPPVGAPSTPLLTTGNWSSGARPDSRGSGGRPSADGRRWAVLPQGGPGRLYSPRSTPVPECRRRPASTARQDCRVTAMRRSRPPTRMAKAGTGGEAPVPDPGSGVRHRGTSRSDRANAKGAERWGSFCSPWPGSRPSSSVPLSPGPGLLAARRARRRRRRQLRRRMPGRRLPQSMPDARCVPRTGATVPPSAPALQVKPSAAPRLSVGKWPPM